MKRKIIQIDEDKCTGCGVCVPGCPEGALQIIDGKARLISDLFCDGLGACIGDCPEGAIKVIEREAEPYDERKVMENIVKAGPNTIKAHLKHLKDHGETEFLSIAQDVLKEKNIDIRVEEEPHVHHAGCPGSRAMAFDDKPQVTGDMDAPSQLTHWPVQMHLVSPRAPHYKNSDLLLAADCVAFSMGNFHQKYLKDKTLAIACPKLDSQMEIYSEKITAFIDEAEINTLTVMIMQVPCCGGLLYLAQDAAAKAKRKVPIKLMVVGLQGEILREEWV